MGSGGRENALAWSMRKCKSIEEIFIAPGNGGTEDYQGCKRLDVKEHNVKGLIVSCKEKNIDLIVIGAESPLAEGLADQLRKEGLVVFGPGADGAQLEASKTWAKELMMEAGIPTAKHWTTKTKEQALEILEKFQHPLVVKADGLAAGKGVTVAESIEETKKAIEDSFQGKFGASGETLVLEERLNGPEVSVFALCDGKRMIVLPPAQDHKRLKEGDEGPNTGGMGAYAPAPLLTQEGLDEIRKLVLEPTLKTLRKRGIDYRGVIYAGLMLTPKGPKVIEFNCRFGNLCSACVVAAASGYPEAAISGDLINIEIQSKKALQIFHAGTRLTEGKKVYTSGGRVLSVVAQGESFDIAFKNAYEGLSKIHFNGITYRKDIGHQVRKF